MTQEDKQLLIQDLCARLPYKVKLWRTDCDEPQTLDTVYIESGVRCQCDDDDEEYIPFENVKPYLRSMEDMTDEEKKEYYSIVYDVFSIPGREADLYNSHHFDYRDLIEKGLAIRVTKENDPYTTI